MVRGSRSCRDFFLTNEEENGMMVESLYIVFSMYTIISYPFHRIGITGKAKREEYYGKL